MPSPLHWPIYYAKIVGMTTAVTDEPVTKTFGHLTLHASRTVDHGYALNVHTGPTRIADLCITTASRAVFRQVYRLIAEHALTGTHPDLILRALREHTATRVDQGMRGNGNPRTDLVAWDQLADAIRSTAEQARLAELVARYHAAAA